MASPPHIDASQHLVHVDGSAGAQPFDPSSTHEVVCALHCAGNRRDTMRTRMKEVYEIDWGGEGEGWRGNKLRVGWGPAAVGCIA